MDSRSSNHKPKDSEPDVLSDENRKRKWDDNRKRKKYLTGDNKISDLLDGWTQCCFLIVNKRRLCNVARCQGSDYCGTHRPINECQGLRAEKDSKKKGVALQRCPCPIDPSHTVYLHNLETHVKICTKSVQQADLAKQSYYRLNCNSGPPLVEEKSLAPLTTAHNLSDVGVLDPDSLVRKIRLCYEQFVAPTLAVEDRDYTMATAAATEIRADDINVVSHTTTNKMDNDNDKQQQDDSNDNNDAIGSAVCAAVAVGQSSFSRLRHAQQDAQIVRAMVGAGLLEDAVSHRSKQREDVDAVPSFTNRSSENRDRISSVQFPDEVPNNNKGSTTVYVELGAGRGMLGLAISSVAPPQRSTVVMVERAGQRGKADKSLREADKIFHRARMDIRHCYVPNLPGVAIPVTSSSDGDSNSSHGFGGEDENKGGRAASAVINSFVPRVVLTAKHLCGVASDLALRSLLAFREEEHSFPSCSDSSSSADMDVCNRSGRTVPSKLNDRVTGLAIATCCHHACVWEDYVGREWLQQLGFTRNDFDVLKLWSGWTHTLRTGHHRRRKEAVVGPSDTSLVEDDEHNQIDVAASGGAAVLRPAGMSYEEMAGVGWMVKRLLDHGRIRFIASDLGFAEDIRAASGRGVVAQQVRYCDSRLSPECMLLLASRNVVRATS